MLLLAGVLIFTLAACPEDEDPDDELDPDELRPSSPHFKEDVHTCYQIFPISFADSTGDGDGDLQGVIDNVEYLSEDLGVDCVWFNPFNEADSYHKYDVTDYYGIDETFGDLETFEELASTFEEHDIEIIMDFVINHTSKNHLWFQRSADDIDDYRDWYTWATHEEIEEDYPGWDGWYQEGDEYYYASFWDMMPELNYESEDVRETIYDLATYWLDHGVDGFRIDAAKHIYDVNQYPEDTDVYSKNIEFFREFNAHIKDHDEDAFIVGEIWDYSDDYIADFYEGMDSAFNFKFSDELLSAINTGRDQDVIETLIETRSTYEEVREDFIDSIFLSNHDMNRVMSQLGEEGKSRLAANILLTLPGLAWVYYGEELGMTGSGEDPQVRQPFIWGEDNPYNTTGVEHGGHQAIAAWDDHNKELDGVEEQLADEDSLLNTYIDLIELRGEDNLYRDGSLRQVDSDSELLTYEREHDGRRVLAVHNLSHNTRTTPHNLDDPDVLHASEDYDLTDESLELEGYGSLILEIDEEADLTE